MSGSLYRSPSAAVYKSPSMSGFAVAAAPFVTSMSVADLGSLTRLEVRIGKLLLLLLCQKLKIFIILFCSTAKSDIHNTNSQ